MRTRTLFLLLIVLLLFWLFKPANAWGEAKRMWAQRELLVRTLVVIIIIYMAYGVYQLYQRGWIVLP
jgi:putative effector of murein hydrolase